MMVSNATWNFWRFLNRWRRDPTMKDDENEDEKGENVPVKRRLTVLQHLAKVRCRRVPQWKCFVFGFSSPFKGGIRFDLSRFCDELLRRCQQLQSQHQQENDRHPVSRKGKTRSDGSFLYDAKFAWLSDEHGFVQCRRGDIFLGTYKPNF